jgi:hypothetical protein
MEELLPVLATVLLRMLGRRVVWTYHRKRKRLRSLGSAWRQLLWGS